MRVVIIIKEVYLIAHGTKKSNIRQNQNVLNYLIFIMNCMEKETYKYGNNFKGVV